VGAVLSIHLAKIAARFFDQTEIIETHHTEKIDAPSGTALETARAILQARGKAFAYPQTERELLSGVRGGQIDGVAIHSLRLPGFVAKQEIIFGGVGQTFSISHNVISRECYMPGIILATKEVIGLKGLIYGLDALLKL
jgi:4-hydroxy-tetrahydrodipicolinate reductase